MDKHMLRRGGWGSKPHLSFLGSSLPTDESTQEPQQNDLVDLETLSVPTEHPATLIEADLVS